MCIRDRYVSTRWNEQFRIGDFGRERNVLFSDLTLLNNALECVNETLKTSKHEANVKENCIVDDEMYDYIQDDYDVASDDSSGPEDDRASESKIYLSFPYSWVHRFHMLMWNNNSDDRLFPDDCSSEYSDWSRNENSDAEYECYLDEDSVIKEAVPSTNSVPVPVRY